MVIDDAGRVGIGTTTPTEKLTISGGAGGTFLKIFNEDSGGDWELVARDGDTGFAINSDLASGPEFIFTASSTMAIGSDPSPDAGLEVIQRDVTTPLFMLSSNSGADGDYFLVDEDGNVGIGTTTPQSAFHFEGGAPSGLSDVQFLVQGGESQQGDRLGGFIGLVGGKGFEGDTSGTSISRGGYVQIIGGQGGADAGGSGVSGQGGIVQISGGAGGIGVNETAAGGAVTITGGDGDVGGDVSLTGGDGTTSDGDVLLAASGSGFVGIGTSAPNDLLDVDGDIRVGSNNNGCVKDGDGTVIAGTCSSDETLKTDIVSLSKSTGKNYLAALMAVEPVTYHWNELASSTFRYGTEEQQTGLIAQQVQETMPELVVEGEDGFLQVRFSELPFYLLQAMKELWAKVDGFSKRFTTEELCLGDTCVTESELQRLLEQSNTTSSGSGATTESNSGTTSDNDGSDETVSGDTGTTSTEDTVATTTEDTASGTATATATTSGTSVDEVTNTETSTTDVSTTPEVVEDETEEAVVEAPEPESVETTETEPTANTGSTTPAT